MQLAENIVRHLFQSLTQAILKNIFAHLKTV